MLSTWSSYLPPGKARTSSKNAFNQVAATGSSTRPASIVAVDAGSAHELRGDQADGAAQP